MHLAVNYNPGVGMHPARWRVADDPHQFYDIKTYIRIAQIAEAAALDMIFLSDVPTVITDPPTDPWHVLEPTVALGAIAVQTERIGLVATASTSFNEPYNVARRIASLDHMSSGRAGWNIVASYRELAAANFGQEIGDHDARYSRATEFVDVVLDLWDSWEDGALVLDQKTGEFVDPSRIHAIHHRGEHFAVRGPLQVPRSPQGRPVLVQAGASEHGLGFGTRYADVIFTMAPTFDAASAFYSDVKARVRGHGRDPDDVTLLASVYPVVGSTEREAREHRDELDALIDLEQEIGTLADQLRIALSTDDLDRPVPVRPTDAQYRAAESQGLNEHVWQLIEANRDLTLRQLLLKDGRRSRPLVGSPEQIADELQQWFDNGAADGFNVSSTHFPQGLERFVEFVVPELQRRGLFRREYQGDTIRDHLGIGIPANRHGAGA